MSSKNQRVDNFEGVADESITSDLIVLGLSFKVKMTKVIGIVFSLKKGSAVFNGMDKTVKELPDWLIF
jgi:hypothetical protein